MSESFKCPACSFGMRVMDSRPTSSTINGQAGVRRRRECLNCKTRITTYEVSGATDIEDLRFSLGRIIGLARNANAALTNLLDEYEKFVVRER